MKADEETYSRMFYFVIKVASDTSFCNSSEFFVALDGASWPLVSPANHGRQMSISRSSVFCVFSQRAEE